MKHESLKNEWVERIFMVLHGRFGNTFFNKYKVGKLNADGEDAGLVNARAVWGSELAGMSPERIKNALEASYEHAPSCDEFKSNCRVKAEVEDYKAISKKLSDIEIAQNKKKLEEINNKLTNKTSRNWVEYWNAILDNPAGEKEITLIGARQALTNLGHKRV